MNQQLEVKPEEKNIPQIQEINQQQTPVETTPKEGEPSHSSEVQKENWRKFREQKEVERKHRIEAEKVANEERAKAEALKAAMEALLNKPSPSNDYGHEETEEQRIEKKVQEALSRREQEYNRKTQEKELAEYPQKLVNDYSDFNQVCSTENLDYIEYHYPELATPFKHMPEGYAKWSAIYKAVKRLVPNPDSKKESQKADKNFQKPQSMSSASNTQGGQGIPPKMLDEQRKAENWKRMQKAIRDVN